MAKRQRNSAKEAYWRRVLKRFSTSGLSVRQFCQREQLAESAFYAWRRTIGERDDAGNSGPAFVPAVINGKLEHEPPLVLKLAGDLELQLPPAIPGTRLAELVRALEMRAEQ
jgi:hypothetical protein